MFKSDESHFTLNATIERDTEKAILISVFELNNPVWMPKSQIEITEDRMIKANDWLVRDKFGTALYIRMSEAREAEKRRAALKERQAHAPAEVKAVRPLGEMDRAKVVDMEKVVVRFEEETGEWTVRRKTDSKVFGRMYEKDGEWIIEEQGQQKGVPSSSEYLGHGRLVGVADDINEDIICRVIR